MKCGWSLRKPAHRRCVCRAIFVSLVGCALAIAGGCGVAPAIDPGVDGGRAALDAALSAWKSGAAVGAVTGTKPPVQAVDSVWGSGKKLKDYEIVAADPGSSPPRWNVRLKMEGQPKAEDAVYVLVGADPVWVYREDDFLRTMNMDDNPTAKTRTRAR